MKFRIGVAALALSWVVAGGWLSAQGQGTPPAPIPRAPGQPAQPADGAPPAQPGSSARPQQSAADREVTLAGCIARDTAKPASAQAPEAFLLTNAKNAESTGSGPGVVEAQYRLMAMGDVNFRPHVGHQVRVTGRVMDIGMAKSAPGSGNRPESVSPGAGQPAAPSRSTMMPPMLHVTALTMVSATCEATAK